MLYFDLERLVFHHSTRIPSVNTSEPLCQGHKLKSMDYGVLVSCLQHRLVCIVPVEHPCQHPWVTQ